MFILSNNITVTNNNRNILNKHYKTFILTIGYMCSVIFLIEFLGHRIKQMFCKNLFITFLTLIVAEGGKSE